MRRSLLQGFTRAARPSCHTGSLLSEAVDFKTTEDVGVNAVEDLPFYTERRYRTGCEYFTGGSGNVCGVVAPLIFASILLYLAIVNTHCIHAQSGGGDANCAFRWTM